MRVNGDIAQIGDKIVPGVDQVELDGEVIQPKRPAPVWIMMNKPPRVVTTRSDEQGRETVMDVLGPEHAALFSVGRLDAMTSGLLLFTNDGETSNRLLHPSRHVEKTYQVRIEGSLDREACIALTDGSLSLDGRPVAPAVLEDLRFGRYALTLREGRNRQVRRMFELVGAKLQTLHRTHFGPLSLGKLVQGQFRPLTPTEVSLLLKETES